MLAYAIRLLSFSIILLALTSESGLANPDAAGTANCLKGNCRDGAGVLIEGKSIYAGDFRGGKKHGRGVEEITSALGETQVFSGNFVNGSRYGHGVLSAGGQIIIGNHISDPHYEIGSVVEVVLAHGVPGYFRAGAISAEGQRLTLLEKMTADAYCRKNPTYGSCIIRIFEQNKEVIVSLATLGAVALFFSSTERYSVDDLRSAVNSLSILLKRRQQERGAELAERIAARLGIR